MQSIGRRYQGPQYNHTDFCDLCGCPWHRTRMVLDADQLLRCPSCQDQGLALTEMAQQAAQATGEIQPLRGKTRDMP
jgi:hypothetical protein